MTPKLYDTQKQPTGSPGFYWKRLCLRGAAITVSCSVVVVICAMLTFRIKEPSGLKWGIAALDRLAIVGFVGASIAAAVGGIGVVLNAASRHRT